MAANYSNEKFKELFGYISEGFKYNLQVLPDIVTSSAILFGILFQSAPMAVFAGALVFVSFLHKYIAEFVGSVVPGLATSSEFKCSGQFPGVTFSHLMGLSGNSQFGKVSTQKVPSYYTLLMGFIIGWIGSLPTIYSQEIQASPTKKTSTFLGMLSLWGLAALVIIHRIFASSCEGFVSVITGLLLGFGIGLLLVFGISHLSERRATNLLGLPLMRDKAADGKPIYVCDRSVE